MKILSRALLLLFVLVGVLIAVSNSQSVQLTLWPLPHIVIMPLYLLVVVLLLLGVLAGLGIGWWAGRHHRRHAREAIAEAGRLEREIQRVRQAAAAAAPPPPPPGPAAPREQRAIERQSAMVAPDLVTSDRRGPFA
ncbi:MAG: lipopolysaccharide assembly protein LapA domain-containing protein [Reyranella sp.]|uniref:lipopolysaccharide assembly protein LapA domain-containing protein n=1 Tax=Reyranella sp. TaxID=1929291 RepID=UPI003D0FEA16